MWVYSTFEAQQYDTISFSRKNPWNWKNIFLIFFRLLKQGLNQLINLVQNRHLGSSCKYLEPIFPVFTLTLKLRVVHIRKKFKILIFSKMAPTTLIKFCRLIVHFKNLKYKQSYSWFCRVSTGIGNTGIIVFFDMLDVLKLYWNL